MKITYSLNLQGEACPYPAIATLDVLPKLKSGENFGSALRLPTKYQFHTSRCKKPWF